MGIWLPALQTSAALCRGLIEAIVVTRDTYMHGRGLPRLYAAASLKHRALAMRI